MRLIAVTALVLGLVVAGAALVSSQTADAQSGPRAKGGLLQVAADYIGVERRALAKELREGSSLARSAVAHGKTRAGLREALLAAIEARVNASPRLTAERKAQILERASARVDRLIDRAGLPKRMRHKAGKGLLKVAAAYIGIERKALAVELRSGKSLSEIAQANGKTRDGLKAALLAATKARIDRRARLTAEQKASALARAAVRIDKLLDRKRSA